MHWGKNVHLEDVYIGCDICGDKNPNPVYTIYINKKHEKDDMIYPRNILLRDMCEICYKSYFQESIKKLTEINNG